MSTPTVESAANVLADPTAYADEPRLHAALGHLRSHAPVAWVDRPPYRPFWAITKHADIMEIERANNLWINEPRPLLATAALDDLTQAQQQAGMAPRTLVHMDDPLHRVVRAIGADWFRPKAMRDLKVRVDELAKIHVDKMRDAGNECDFVQEIAVNYPLYVIMSLLGLPESDFPRMLKLTQEVFGGDDDEYKRGTTPEEQVSVLLDFFAYFTDLTESRRRHPTEDLASAIANARIDGEPLSPVDAVGYYAIIATAGHDTTMRGAPIAAGESVYLAYVSGNRDEEVFDDPFRFDVGRDPNKHLAFGYGVHFCLGAALARMEVKSFFAELLPRLKSIEVTAPPELAATTFVGGLKHLPIRYELWN